jgi:AmmeMemoRadiSam system protein B
MGEATPCEKKVRSPIASGLYYPENKKNLLERLASYETAELHRGKSSGRAAAIVAPHGAWNISGPIAAAAFAAARDRDISRVVLLGPIHQGVYQGLYLSDSDAFDTPLGKLPVDREIVEDLASCSTLFEVNDIPHLEEHSLEVLLPLVKFRFPEAQIVPVLMGGGRFSHISGLARALNLVFESLMDHTLLVISCNLSQDSDGEKARLRAEEFLGLLGEKKSQDYLELIGTGKINACGAPLAASLMESGLLEHRSCRLLWDFPGKAHQEEGKTVYYGAVSFE